MAGNIVPKEKWSTVLHAHLKDKSREVFEELSVDQCQNYDVVKQKLIALHCKVPDFYRKRSSSMCKENGETSFDFALRIAWASETVRHEVEKALYSFALEQGLRGFPADVGSWIMERKPRSFTEISNLADEYNVWHTKFGTKCKPNFSQS